MKQVLRIDSSVFAEAGVSSQLANQMQQKLLSTYPQLKVVNRSFAADPVRHLDGAHLGALMTPAEERSEQQQQAVAYSDELIAEVRDADAIILTAPMYNFQVPSMLKAWFDHLARAGETFQYTDNGPVGLLRDKPVYVITTRGGVHRDQPSDTIESFVKTMLGFLGLTQVTMIFAEGLSMGDDARSAAISAAEKQIAAIAIH
ncbi:NAD(P)H-dependent oxidoreductase [Neiella sp. HB171785]|uniref:FMN dependent NADH:quinone oxidoreductase n=1 Tax=Neiella litorisoli TaxID=2771431 RepID=A0A8J6QHT2_9GAMM|nr:NAD(P)H-dependent oxidoreductase [Neiella litorisoli]MBD1387986.1 NAD(P)H-dependent oxidoreductase [Neiella litorisoli]